MFIFAKKNQGWNMQWKRTHIVIKIRPHTILWQYMMLKNVENMHNIVHMP
jgi:hypothetical protein